MHSYLHSVLSKLATQSFNILRLIARNPKWLTRPLLGSPRRSSAPTLYATLVHTWSQPNTKYLCCWLGFSATHVFHPSLSCVRIMEFLEKSLRIQSYVYDWIHTVVPFVSHSQSILWTPQPTPLSDSHLKFLEFHHHSPCSSLASSSSLVSPPRIKVLATRETNLYEMYLPGCIKEILVFTEMFFNQNF